MVYDIIVVGGGPAGLTAAIHARARAKSVLLVTNQPTASPLCKAPLVDNYPALPHVSGLELVERMVEQATDMGAELRQGKVLSIMPMGSSSFVSVGNDVAEGKAVILAVGAGRASPIPGEEALLGKGVSYCATCDGMFYRDREIVVAGNAPDLAEETEYLRSIGCRVTEATLAGLSILGDSSVTGVRLRTGKTVPCEGVFLLRASMAPAQLVPGLELDGPYIKADRFMSTNVQGIFAAGDCTGEPLQLAKAVGEGQMAAHSALDWISELEN